MTALPYAVRKHPPGSPERRTPEALAGRLQALQADAGALADDLRTARDAAEPGAKAPYRYPLRHLERASALIAAAAAGTGGSK